MSNLKTQADSDVGGDVGNGKGVSGGRLADIAPGGRDASATDGEADTETEVDLAPKAQSLEPIIDKYGKPSGASMLFLFGVAFVALAAGVAWMARDQIGEPVLLAILGALAGVGVFFLFLLLMGFVQLTASRRSDEFSKNLMNGMDSGVIVTDREGRIIYANRAYGDLTGAKDALEVASVETVFSRSTQASEIIYRLATQSKAGTAVSEEFRLPGGLISGQEGARWFRLRVRQMQHSDYPDGATVWQLSDVTADRQAQEASFLELQHAIHYLDHAPAGFFSSEADGAIAYLNATLADWLGVDLALFQPGRLRISDFVSEHGIDLIDAVRAEDGKTKTAVIDVDFTREDGSRMPVRLYHKVSQAADGAPGMARTLVINRLAKEETDSALLDAELRFTRFFNNTPIAIAAVSPKGKTMRTNSTFMRMFKGQLGASGKGEGVSLTGLVQESDQEQVRNALKVAVSGKAETQMINATMAGDDERYLRLFLSPVIDGPQADNSDERVIVYALETTDQRKLEEQFAQGQKMQAVGQLAGGVAHDFNNVLTAIIGFSDLLLANHRPSDPSFQDIMNIKQNANRAASLVRQLLAFSRRQTLRPQVLQFGEVLSDLRTLLDRLLGEKVDLKVVHGRDLWPVKADISQLEQVVVNLAVNARDAMPEGGELTLRTANVPGEDVRKKFDFREMVAADYVLLEVRDEGTGMSEEVMEKIFEPFFSTKEVGKGTGLGLSTVYGIVKQTGGYIYPQSKPGEGTSFLVFLPRHEPKAEDEVVASDKPGKESAKDLTGSATILLVEDEDAVRAFASRALQSRGYTVHEAASGVEALEVLEEYSDEIDLIVSDVVMPEMDGPTLLREVRKNHPDLKFIFVSGYAEEAFARNLPEEERERFGFLAKPFSLKQLATTVKEMLEE
jgi:two-component system cell cycle sensor histidine kinase/response regulator CckA